VVIPKPSSFKYHQTLFSKHLQNNTFACVATATASALPTMPRRSTSRHSLPRLYMQRRSMPRHSLAMGSSRARPVLLIDDEDLDIVMENNGNGRLRELYNELLLPDFAFVSAGEADKVQISFCRFKDLADKHNREFRPSYKVERR
jgi:hypothetical protein